MNSPKVSRVFFFSLLIFSLVLTTFSVIGNTEEKASDQKYNATIAKWKEYSSPNENHKLLGSFVGRWNYKVKWWISPDAKPEESRGTYEVKWIMGGRFIQQSAQGKSMGQQFKGMGVAGYDNAEKQYKSVWIDNMGTGMMMSSGNYDPSTKTFVEKGTFTDPVEGKKSYRGVTKIINKDKYTFEMYVSSPEGKEFRMMEIVYVRKK